MRPTPVPLPASEWMTKVTSCDPVPGATPVRVKVRVKVRVRVRVRVRETPCLAGAARRAARSTSGCPCA
eukprot:scaffold105102_cov28-Phaeocystis_antarctica.AAC.1